MWYSVGVLIPPGPHGAPAGLPAEPSVESFKAWTREKLAGLRCPRHHQPPRLKFEGASLRDIRISMSGCCDCLISIANRAIASQQ
jgi:hypothetical protein